MVQMILSFCLLSGQPCIEVPIPDPMSQIECLAGGPIYASRWLEEHPMDANQYRLEGWKCVPFSGEKGEAL